MILKSVALTVSSLGDTGIYIFDQNFLTCMSFTYCSVALAKPFRAAQRYASPELKASKASWEKQASHRIVRRRLWFMALSTSEFVADNLSASSVEGASGAHLVLTSASWPDVGAWLVEARLATSPDVVRRGLFVLKIARMLICPDRITPGKQRVHYTFALESQYGLHSFLPHGALRPLVG